MGKITVIGIGPGSLEDMTPRARQAIEQAVQEYNQNVARLNDLGVKMEELTQSIDSMQKLGE